MFFKRWRIGDACSLNRNILECKFEKIAENSDAIAVLIETYWNVNTKKKRGRGLGFWVLIETYWNVN